MAEVGRIMKDGFEPTIGAIQQDDAKDRRLAEETGARIGERVRVLTERNRIAGPAPLHNPFHRN